MIDKELQKQGANARALGTSEFDNPFYSPEKMPMVTGETIQVWQDKLESWASGWKLEDIVRS